MLETPGASFPGLNQSEGHVATIVGTTGNDTINGTTGRDVIVGGAGTDTGDGGPGKNFYKDVEQHP